MTLNEWLFKVGMEINAIAMGLYDEELKAAKPHLAELEQLARLVTAVKKGADDEQ